MEKKQKEEEGEKQHHHFKNHVKVESTNHTLAYPKTNPFIPFSSSPPFSSPFSIPSSSPPRAALVVPPPPFSAPSCQKSVGPMFPRPPPNSTSSPSSAPRSLAPFFTPTGISSKERHRGDRRRGGEKGGGAGEREKKSEKNVLEEKWWNTKVESGPPTSLSDPVPHILLSISPPRPPSPPPTSFSLFLPPKFTAAASSPFSPCMINSPRFGTGEREAKKKEKEGKHRPQGIKDSNNNDNHNSNVDDDEKRKKSKDQKQNHHYAHTATAEYPLHSICSTLSQENNFVDADEKKVENDKEAIGHLVCDPQPRQGMRRNSSFFLFSSPRDGSFHPEKELLLLPSSPPSSLPHLNKETCDDYDCVDDCQHTDEAVKDTSYRKEGHVDEEMKNSSRINEKMNLKKTKKEKMEEVEQKISAMLMKIHPQDAAKEKIIQRDQNEDTRRKWEEKPGTTTTTTPPTSPSSLTQSRRKQQQQTPVLISLPPPLFSSPTSFSSSSAGLSSSGATPTSTPSSLPLSPPFSAVCVLRSMDGMEEEEKKKTKVGHSQLHDPFNHDGSGHHTQKKTTQEEGKKCKQEEKGQRNPEKVRGPRRKTEGGEGVEDKNFHQQQESATEEEERKKKKKREQSFPFFHHLWKHLHQEAEEGEGKTKQGKEKRLEKEMSFDKLHHKNHRRTPKRNQNESNHHCKVSGCLRVTTVDSPHDRRDEVDEENNNTITLDRLLAADSSGELCILLRPRRRRTTNTIEMKWEENPSIPCTNKVERKELKRGIRISTNSSTIVTVRSSQFISHVSAAILSGNNSLLRELLAIYRVLCGKYYDRNLHEKEGKSTSTGRKHKEDTHGLPSPGERQHQDLQQKTKKKWTSGSSNSNNTSRDNNTAGGSSRTEKDVIEGVSHPVPTSPTACASVAVHFCQHPLYYVEEEDTEDEEKENNDATALSSFPFTTGTTYSFPHVHLFRGGPRVILQDDSNNNSKNIIEGKEEEENGRMEGQHRDGLPLPLPPPPPFPSDEKQAKGPWKSLFFSGRGRRGERGKKGKGRGEKKEQEPKVKQPYSSIWPSHRSTNPGGDKNGAVEVVMTIASSLPSSSFSSSSWSDSYKKMWKLLQERKRSWRKWKRNFRVLTATERKSPLLALPAGSSAFPSSSSSSSLSATRTTRTNHHFHPLPERNTIFPLPTLPPMDLLFQQCVQLAARAVRSPHFLDTVVDPATGFTLMHVAVLTEKADIVQVCLEDYHYSFPPQPRRQQQPSSPPPTTYAEGGPHMVEDVEGHTPLTLAMSHVPSMARSILHLAVKLDVEQYEREQSRMGIHTSSLSPLPRGGGGEGGEEEEVEKEGGLHHPALVSFRHQKRGIYRSSHLFQHSLLHFAVMMVKADAAIPWWGEEKGEERQRDHKGGGGRLEFIKTLIEVYCMDASQVNRFGYTPARWAREFQQPLITNAITAWRRNHSPPPPSPDTFSSHYGRQQQEPQRRPPSRQGWDSCQGRQGKRPSPSRMAQASRRGREMVLKMIFYLDQKAREARHFSPPPPPPLPPPTHPTPEKRRSIMVVPPCTKNLGDQKETKNIMTNINNKKNNEDDENGDAVATARGREVKTARGSVKEPSTRFQTQEKIIQQTKEEIAKAANQKHDQKKNEKDERKTKSKEEEQKNPLLLVEPVQNRKLQEKKGSRPISPRRESRVSEEKKERDLSEKNKKKDHYPDHPLIPETGEVGGSGNVPPRRREEEERDGSEAFLAIQRLTEKVLAQFMTVPPRRFPFSIRSSIIHSSCSTKKTKTKTALTSLMKTQEPPVLCDNNNGEHKEDSKGEKKEQEQQQYYHTILDDHEGGRRWQIRAPPSSTVVHPTSTSEKGEDGLRQGGGGGGRNGGTTSPIRSSTEEKKGLVDASVYFRLPLFSMSLLSTAVDRFRAHFQSSTTRIIFLLCLILLHMMEYALDTAGVMEGVWRNEVWGTVFQTLFGHWSLDTFFMGLVRVGLLLVCGIAFGYFLLPWFFGYIIGVRLLRIPLLGAQSMEEKRSLLRQFGPLFYYFYSSRRRYQILFRPIGVVGGIYAAGKLWNQIVLCFFYPVTYESWAYVPNHFVSSSLDGVESNGGSWRRWFAMAVKRTTASTPSASSPFWCAVFDSTSFITPSQVDYVCFWFFFVGLTLALDVLVLVYLIALMHQQGRCHAYLPHYTYARFFHQWNSLCKKVESCGGGSNNNKKKKKNMEEVEEWKREKEVVSETEEKRENRLRMLSDNKAFSHFFSSFSALFDAPSSLGYSSSSSRLPPCSSYRVRAFWIFLLLLWVCLAGPFFILAGLRFHASSSSSSILHASLLIIGNTFPSLFTPVSVETTSTSTTVAASSFSSSTFMEAPAMSPALSPFIISKAFGCIVAASLALFVLACIALQEWNWPSHVPHPSLDYPGIGSLPPSLKRVEREEKNKTSSSMHKKKSHKKVLMAVDGKTGEGGEWVSSVVSQSSSPVFRHPSLVFFVLLLLIASLDIRAIVEHIRLLTEWSGWYLGAGILEGGGGGSSSSRSSSGGNSSAAEGGAGFVPSGVAAASSSSFPSSRSYSTTTTSFLYFSTSTPFPLVSLAAPLPPVMVVGLLLATLPAWGGAGMLLLLFPLSTSLRVMRRVLQREDEMERKAEESMVQRRRKETVVGSGDIFPSPTSIAAVDYSVDHGNPSPPSRPRIPVPTTIRTRGKKKSCSLLRLRLSAIFPLLYESWKSWAVGRHLFSVPVPAIFAALRYASPHLPAWKQLNQPLVALLMSSSSYSAATASSSRVGGGGGGGEEKEEDVWGSGRCNNNHGRRSGSDGVSNEGLVPSSFLFPSPVSLLGIQEKREWNREEHPRGGGGSSSDAPWRRMMIMSEGGGSEEEELQYYKEAAEALVWELIPW